MDSTVKQLGDALKQAHVFIEDCFALVSDEVYSEDDHASICGNLDEAAACLDSALKLVYVEAL
jgi:hypothetical protein